eukprot:6202999-Pleurochrysis_carterae.AAC.2
MQSTACMQSDSAGAKEQHLPRTRSNTCDFTGSRCGQALATSAKRRIGSLGVVTTRSTHMQCQELRAQRSNRPRSQRMTLQRIAAATCGRAL